MTKRMKENSMQNDELIEDARSFMRMDEMPIGASVTMGRLVDILTTARSALVAGKAEAWDEAAVSVQLAYENPSKKQPVNPYRDPAPSPRASEEYVEDEG